MRWLAIALFVAACGGDSKLTVESACNHMCDCRIELGMASPDDRPDCIQDCQTVEFDEHNRMNPDCVECFNEAACLDLQSCNPICSAGRIDAAPPPGGIDASWLDGG